VEAVRLYGALAEAYQGTFTPALALSLNNLAIKLGHLGRHEESAAACDKAVIHYRALVAADPDAFTSDLALCLNTLAATLSHHAKLLAGHARTVKSIGVLRPSGKDILHELKSMPTPPRAAPSSARDRKEINGS
jgi:hypothetical protein